MKSNKTKICHLGILLIFYALMVFLLMHFEYAYGSKTDWMNQHYAIPDYFRKLFYETGDLFPSFAPNIGAGEYLLSFLLWTLFANNFVVIFIAVYKNVNLYSSYKHDWYCSRYYTILYFYKQKV